MAKHNIVYSVKGGSGKSMIALFLQLYEMRVCDDLNELSKDFLEGNWIFEAYEDDNPENYLVDLDFTGSMLKAFLINVLNVPDDKPSLTQYVAEGKKLEELIYTLEKAKMLGSKLPANVNVIVASDGEKEKEIFRIRQRQDVALKFDLFKVKFNRLIRDIKEHSGEKKHAIITYDLPPNADAYVDILLRLLLYKEARKEKTANGGDIEEEVNLFLVTKPDKNAIYANIEWLKRFMKSTSRHPKRIFWILNDVKKNSLMINEYNELLSTIVNELNSACKNCKSEKYISAVYNNEEITELIMKQKNDSIPADDIIEKIKLNRNKKSDYFNVWRIKWKT